MFINIMEELGGLLLEVEKPDRYTGGEYGRLARREAQYQSLIAFPDLYEIGMGNQALKIIYNRLNNIEDISCDRAFAPAPDFEKLLRDKKIPLYGLDTGIDLLSLDLLMFTVDYELGLGGILCMLDVSGIPLRCENRTAQHPVIIAGGPAVSNPVPYSPFIDAFWAGDAEAGFFELVKELAFLKKKGQGREDQLKKIKDHPNIWVKGKPAAKRAIAADFNSISEAAVFPVPSMKIIQHHGTVEIMRGCPNGCRFCHAGYWYRPMRQKSIERVCSHAREMADKGGWREISLSSLSSGDYSGIGNLIDILNAQFKDKHISFQMPSLKVSSFSLDLLEKISATRKSGLTFAVETPDDLWQLAINKEVNRDNVTSILLEAKKRGWKSAKFYFLIGLPLNYEKTCKSEEELILDFITSVSRRTHMSFNINIALFVPKPHTPYEKARQLDSVTAVEKFNFLQAKLKVHGHRVSVSDTLISRIEGLMSRGDERSGYLFEEAYLCGSRLEAWNEYINKDIWRKLFNENSWIESEILSGRNAPWKVIDSGISDNYLNNECKKSVNEQFTKPCSENCGHNCGICGNKNKIVINSAVAEAKNNNTGVILNETAKNNQSVNADNKPVNNCHFNEIKTDPSIYRLLFSFTKQGSAVFHGHLSLIEVFSMAFTRADLPALYTQGYNPLLKMEFASPLATGISAENEIAAVDFPCVIEAQNFIIYLNDKLPEGIRIINAECFYIKNGMKKYSLSSLLWGYAYSRDNNIDYIKASEEKKYRLTCNGDNTGKSGLYQLKRKEVLARNLTNINDSEYISYFDVYRYLYS
jgi:radical SAM superfamily enzyme YgiQ (UPF0313 family)